MPEEKETRNEIEIRGAELVEKIKELINEGNVRRIIIKDEHGKIFMEIPVTVGLIGTLFMPVLAAVGALAAVVAKFTIEIIRVDK